MNKGVWKTMTVVSAKTLCANTENKVSLPTNRAAALRLRIVHPAKVVAFSEVEVY